MRLLITSIPALWLSVMLLSASPALATHKANHEPPPACEKAQGQAPEANKHCYPPLEGPATSSGKAFGLDAPDPDAPATPGGISFGHAVLALAGVLAGLLFVRRRWIHPSQGG